MSTVTPKLVLTSLLSLCFNNRLVPHPLDLDESIEVAASFLAGIKGEVKDSISTLMELIKRVNICAVPYSRGKLLDELKSSLADFHEWEDYVDARMMDPTTVDQAYIISELHGFQRLMTLPKLAEIIKKASRDLNFNPMGIKSVPEYVSELISQLEGELTGAGKSDAAISLEIDFSDGEALEAAFVDVQERNNGDGNYVLGFQAMNTALQGGLRPGDTVMLGALEHNYKSGMAKLFFRQIAKYNKPPSYPATEVKKPLLMFVSFEEPLSDILQFLFISIVYNETLQPVDVTKYTPVQMRDKVMTTLTENGWHVKMLRVNPTDWTYRNFIEKVLQFISEGYDPKVVITDYLLQMPTIGCDRSGAQGTDLRDLVRRVKSFMSSKKILFITPGQLSPQVKDKIIDGTPERDILDTIMGQGLYAGSKQINQELDVSILLKKVRTRQGDFLDIMIDKHRTPIAIDMNLKHFAMPFPPNGMPILDDLLAPSPSHRFKIPLDY